MTWPITFADVLSARERIRPHLPPTPLRSYAPLDAAVGRGIRVLVKHENHCPTGAFKARNGLAVMTSLTAALALLLSASPQVIGFLVILIIDWLIVSALAAAVSALLRAVKFQ